MSLATILDFANKNQIAHIATVEGNNPRVRAFLMWFADESGFYFHTSKTKEVGKQLLNNPTIEACFSKHTEDPMEKSMLRVSGSAEEVKDDSLKAKLLEERPFLKDVMPHIGEDALFLFRIVKGEATHWSMADNLNEANLPRITF